MFNLMAKDGIKPNGVSFISVLLSACTHAGLVKVGQRCFLSMIHDFHILSEIEHYGCMVDLLCKAALLQDALQLIEETRMEPNAVIWGALLGGCKLQKNLEIAMIAVDKLMILEPDNSGYYTLLVNTSSKTCVNTPVGLITIEIKY
ncbi:putative tetratricopeptide-like helical domain superfamily [Helianthus debilis subsp. tardiflorus]